MFWCMTWYSIAMARHCMVGYALLWHPAVLYGRTKVERQAVALKLVHLKWSYAQATTSYRPPTILWIPATIIICTKMEPQKEQ